MVRIFSSGRVPALYKCEKCNAYAYRDRSEAKQAIKRMHTKGLSPYKCPHADVFHVGRDSS